MMYGLNLLHQAQNLTFLHYLKMLLKPEKRTERNVVNNLQISISSRLNDSLGGLKLINSHNSLFYYSNEYQVKSITILSLMKIHLSNLTCQPIFDRYILIFKKLNF